MAKPKPEKVIPNLAIKAYEATGGEMNKVYSEYIRLHYRATGQLAPGCDAKDLIAWFKNTL